NEIIRRGASGELTGQFVHASEVPGNDGHPRVRAPRPFLKFARLTGQTTHGVPRGQERWNQTSADVAAGAGDEDRIRSRGWRCHRASSVIKLTAEAHASGNSDWEGVPSSRT